MSSRSIGTLLRQHRLNRGLALEDIVHETRIPKHFLELIEAEDFEHLPALIFTRNFVRQYALALQIDPEPILEDLPKLDESARQLPQPPPASPHMDFRTHADVPSSLASSAAWLLLASVAIIAAYVHFNQTSNVPARKTPAAVFRAARSSPAKIDVEPARPAPAPLAESRQVAISPVQVSPQAPAPVPADQPPIQVVVTAHDDVWVQMTADDKDNFTGTLKPNETREIRADEQVKILAGNAGGLSISLNGKPLDPIGPLGQVRALKLTADGPEFLPRSPQPSYFDPL